MDQLAVRGPGLPQTWWPTRIAAQPASRHAMWPPLRFRSARPARPQATKACALTADQRRSKPQDSYWRKVVRTQHQLAQMPTRLGSPRRSLSLWWARRLEPPQPSRAQRPRRVAVWSFQPYPTQHVSPPIPLYWLSGVRRKMDDGRLTPAFTVRGPYIIVGADGVTRRILRRPG